MIIKAMIVFCLFGLALLPSINAITISPGKNITEGNCSGQFDHFLCRCMEFNTTIDIHLLPGRYYLTDQPFCLLHNKANVQLIGGSSNNTIIECKEPFNIVFIRMQSVIISNIMMVNCGNIVNDFINQTVFDLTGNTSHFGSGFRFAIMFYQVQDITITEFVMQNTLGYGIIALNAAGKITVSKLNIKNTTFENDPKCDGYNYNSDAADSICSGSGLFIIYFDIPDSHNDTTATLTIDQSNFRNNRNILSYNQLRILNDAITTGFYQTSIPLQGAAGITVFYLQRYFDVNATITNSLFHNNNGTLSASITVGSLSTTRGKTLIKNCLFDDNNRINRPIDVNSIPTRGGISYYYLTLINTPFDNANICANSTVIEIVAVVQCNFTKLGGTLGAAIHIEKLSTNLLSLGFRIEQCNFIANEANVGSAVHAVDHRFDATLTNGLIVNLVNVNAKSNILLPGTTIEFFSSSFISGVFHSETCHFIFNCTVKCEFLNNQPSVFYGQSAYLTISGKAMFVGNTARFGGGLHLLNTVVFIYQNSEIYFGKNHATRNGGAIDVFSSNANVQSQDICPIQFTGPESVEPIFSLDKIDQLNLNVTFEENTAVSTTSLESIFSRVFYVCTWYPSTLTQIYLGLRAPLKNGTRQSVYREIFNFVPPSSANQHTSILSYLPCLCDQNNTFDSEQCLIGDLDNTLKLGTTVIIGRSFTISLITLDVVGSIGHSVFLNSEVSSSNTTDNVLMLPREQISRSFSIVNRTCEKVDFTIYALQSTIPRNGTLQLSVSRNSNHNLHFSIDECPVGFSLENVSGLFACTCGTLFTKLPIKEDFECNSLSGNIERVDIRSWLSVINGRVEYTRLCLPEYCNDSVSNYSLTDTNVLCNLNHEGRACGACDDGYGKLFGSNFCRKCNNIWLVTILLYGILGIVLVLIIHLLKLTVTIGTINGLIFFCNVMSINDVLFFNPSEFSFVRLYISLINLDLGFEMCFYREMSQTAKIGLQFVFPLYLWLIMFIIIMVGKRYIRSRKSTHSAVPVLATLILLSYSKLLRTTISVFSFVTIYYSTKENNFSKLQKFIGWQPDPSIQYLEGAHIVLFLVALVFMLLFILPLAFGLTFPKVVLRSRKMSYFFPLFDCIYAPYKDRYRYWFGVRLIVLIYFTGMESILFSYQNALLLSGLVVILLFTIIQAYMHPFKNKSNNILDLIFMGIFITLAIVILYLYPDTSGDEVNISVNILGGLAFLLLCFITIFHTHDTLLNFTPYSNFNEAFKKKFSVQINKIIRMDWGPLGSDVARSRAVSIPPVNNIHNYDYLQESLLEEQFN